MATAAAPGGGSYLADMALLQRLADHIALLNSTLTDPHTSAVVAPGSVVDAIAEIVTNEVFPDGDDDDTPQAARSELVTDAVAELLLLDPSQRRAAAARGSAGSEADTIATVSSLASYVGSALAPEQVSSGSIPVKALQTSFQLFHRLIVAAGGVAPYSGLVAVRKLALDTFLLVHRLGSHQVVQCAALEVFHALAASARLTAGDLDVRGALETLQAHALGAASTTGQGVRSCALRTLGTLALKFPAEVTPSAPKLLSCFLAELKKQAGKADPDATLAEGILAGLNDYLTSFGESVEEGAAYLPIVYRFVKAALMLAENTTRYGPSRAALSMLRRHALMFKEFITEDAEGMSLLLISLCGHKNVPLHKAAFPAASAFVQVVAMEICTSTKRPAEANAATLAKMLTQLKKLLAGGGRYETSYAIIAYGLLARPLAKFVGRDHVAMLLSELSLHCNAIFSRSRDEMEEATTHLSQYVHTLACLLLEVSEVTPSHVEAVDKLLTDMLHLYPMQFHFPRLRMMLPQALLKLFFACARHPATLTVLPAFIREGLALSVATSDALGERATNAAPNAGAEAAGGADDDDDVGALYDEYLPMWRGLVAPVPSQVLLQWGFPWSHTPGVTPADVMVLVATVRAAIVRQAVAMLGAFDLQCSQVQLGDTAAAAAVPATGTLAPHEAHLGALSTAQHALAPANPKDYMMYLNAVQLFVGIAPDLLVPDEVDAWGPPLVHVCAEHLAQAPHASGSFTMLAAVVTAVAKAPAFLAALQDHAAASTPGSTQRSTQPARATPVTTAGSQSAQRQLRRLCDVLSRLVHQTHDRSVDMRSELLAAALRFMLACPTGLVPAKLLLGPIKQALALAADHPTLAAHALDSIARFDSVSLGLSQRDAVAELAPSLSTLAQFCSAAVAADGAASAQRDLQDKLVAVVARFGVMLASVDASDAMQRSSIGFAVKSAQPALVVRLPFRDVSLDFPLDSLVPRIVQLSRSSHDRAARVAACELLHGMVLCAIGTSSRPMPSAAGTAATATSADGGSSEGRAAAADILAAAIPVVVELAVSLDPVPQQLFRPLVFQAVRWYAQSANATESRAMLDALTQGLASPSNAALRSISAEALCEYQRWTIKLHAAPMAACAPLYRRLFAQCTHPCTWQRLGAAVAFNALVRDLYHAEDLIAELVMDIVFYAFTALCAADRADQADPRTAADASDTQAAPSSVSGGDAAVHQLKQVLHNMEKIIAKKPSLLLDAPAGGSTVRALTRFQCLSDLVNWLFEQIGCGETHARHMAMRLFVTCCTSLPGYETDDGVTRWLSANRQGSGGVLFDNIFHAFSVTEPHKVLNSAMAVGKYTRWAQEIEAAAECHAWLIAAKFLPPHVAFGAKRHGNQAAAVMASPDRLAREGGHRRHRPEDVASDTPQRIDQDRRKMHRTDADATAHSTNLPQSELFVHVYYFLRQLVGSTPLATAGVDSQEVWLAGSSALLPALPAPAPTVEAETTARRLSTLESVAELLEVLLERYPSCVWLAADAEVKQHGEGKVAPVLHPPLYEAIATALLNPARIFTQAATDTSLCLDVAKLGKQLLKAVWGAACTNKSLEGEREGIIAALKAALVFDPYDLGATAAAVDADPVAALAAARGMRAVHESGALLYALEGLDGRDRAAAATRCARKLFVTVQDLVTAPPDASSSEPVHGAHLSSSAAAVVRELAALAFSVGLPAASLVTAVMDDTAVAALTGATASDAELERAASAATMRRSATLSSLSAAAATPAGTRGSRLLRALAAEIESFAGRHPLALLEATIPHLDANRGIAYELVLKVAHRVGEGRVAIEDVAQVAARWAPHIPTVAATQDFDAVDFHLAVAKHFLAASPSIAAAALPACAAAYRRMVLSILAPSGSDPRVFTRHRLLDDKKAVRLVRCACDIAATLIERQRGPSTAGVAARDTFEETLASAVGAVITDEFPVEMAELTAGTVRYDTYIDIVGSLLDLCRAAASPAVLFAFLALLRHQDHELAATMRSSVTAAVRAMSPEDQVACCKRAMLAQQGALPLDVRRALTQRVAIPALRSMDVADAERFYAGEVQSLVKVVSEIPLLPAVPADVNNEVCVSRTCAFVMVEAMYRRCRPDALRGSINKAFCGIGNPTGKELTERVVRACNSAKSLIVGTASTTAVHQPTLLHLRQAAYSCLVAVMMATQRQEKLFVQFLLKEKNNDLWHALIDTTTAHMFDVETRLKYHRNALEDLRATWESDVADVTTGNDEAVTRVRARNELQRIKLLSSQFLAGSHVHPSTPPHKDEAVDAITVASQTAAEARRATHHTHVMASATKHKASLVASLDAEMRPTQHPRDGGAPAPDVIVPEAGAPADDLNLLGSFSQSGALRGVSEGGAGARVVPTDVEVDRLWASGPGATLLRLINHLVSLFGSEGYGGSAPTPGGSAAWIREFVSVITAPSTALNVRLFMVRIVTLCSTLFEPFAADLFTPMAELAIRTDLGNGLHYYARDIIVTLLRWRGNLPPYTHGAEAAAASIVSHVVRHVSHGATFIFRENLELLRCIVVQWKGRVAIDKADVLGWLATDQSAANLRQARMCGVQLCAVIIASGAPLHNPRVDDRVISEELFYKHLAANLSKQHRDVTSAAAEVCGMALAAAEAATRAPAAPPTATDRLQLLRTVVGTKLLGISHEETPDKFLHLLRRVAVQFPAIVDDFMPAQLFRVWHRASTTDRLVVLELLKLRADATPSLYHTLSSQLYATASGAMPDAQRVALCRLLAALVPNMAADDVGHLVATWLSMLGKAITDATGGGRASVDGRVAFYTLCIDVYNRHEAAIPRPIADDVARYLATGLADRDLFVRDLLLSFWNDERRLAAGAMGRFRGVFERLSAAALGPVWLQFSAILMLFGVHRSPDFTRTDSIFPHPLAQCAFRPATIDTSAVVRSVPLTPMFSTQNQVPVSQIATGVPESLGGAPRERRTRVGSVGPLVAATVEQSLFPSTQTGTFATFDATLARVAPRHTSALLLSNAAAPATPASSSNSGDASSAGGSAAAPAQQLMTRFRAIDAEHRTRRHIMSAARSKQRQSVAAAAERTERQHRVQVFRTYREGEVPDIQVSLQALIVPLQAVCLHDLETARATLAIISDGIFASVRNILDHSASAPTSGGGATHRIAPTIPNTAAMFTVASSAPDTTELRDVRESVRAQLREVLAAANDDAVLVRFVHERLIGDEAAVDSIAPSTVFASALTSGCFETAVLLLEVQGERLGARRATLKRQGSSTAAASPRLREELDQVAAHEREVYLRLFMAHEQRGDSDAAVAFARRFLPRADAMAEYAAAARIGDVEGGLSHLSTSLNAAERNGDDAAVRAVRHVQHTALAQLLRWDDVAASFDGFLTTPDRQDDLWDADHVHEVRLYVRAKARSDKTPVRAALLRALNERVASTTPHAAKLAMALQRGLGSTSLALDRAMLHFDAGEFNVCARVCSLGVAEGLRSWASHREPGAVAALQHLVQLRDASVSLLSQRMHPTQIASHALATISAWHDDSGSGVAVPPREWDDLLDVRSLASSKLLARLEGVASDVDTRRLAGVPHGASVYDYAAREVLRTLHQTCYVAGSSLAARATTNLASKVFLERAIGSSGKVEPNGFSMPVWSAVVRATIVRAAEVNRLRGAPLRTAFGNIQTFMKNKAEKMGLESHAEYKRPYAALQGSFWAALTTRCVETDGASCYTEVAPMVAKCVKKFRSAVGDSAGTSSAVGHGTQATLGAALGDVAPDVAVYTSFGRYCADMLEFVHSVKQQQPGNVRDKTGDDLLAQLATNSVQYLVRGMEARDPIARRLFPRVLQALLAHPAASTELSKYTTTISTWHVLPWIGQLLSTLLTPAAPAVAPLVKRVAIHYPQQAFYPYSCLQEELSELHRVAAAKCATEPALAPVADVTALLQSILTSTETVKLRTFVDGLHKLHHPELRFRAWWDDMKTQLQEHRDAVNATAETPETRKAAAGAARRAQELWEACYADCFDTLAVGVGTYNKKFARDWEAAVRRELCDPAAPTTSRAGALRLDYERYRRTSRIADEMRNKLAHREHMALSAFSETLASAQLSSHGSDYVELPMQPFRFLDAATPTALPHIVAVDRTLLVMGSVQKPKRLTVTTSDERQLHFLVKGGDDLRLDQRLQQLFATVNSILRDADEGRTAPGRPPLAARTYSVIPVSKKVGMAEWVSDTEPMKRTIERAMHSDASLAGRSPSIDAHPATKHMYAFVNDVESHRTDLNIYQRYVQMYKVVSNKDGSFSARVREWLGLVNPRYLRDGLATYASTPSDWFNFRARFVQSTAVVSAGSYVLGVGDRHLQNYLMDKASGDTVAIDFGHAFGSATTALGIPELVPMRLTSQMVNVAGPLGAEAFMPAMEATLAAMQRQRSLLMALMATFLHEPLLGWEGKPTQAAAGAPLPAVTGVSQNTHKKLEIVRRKLAMEHPVAILADEVRSNPHVQRAHVTEQCVEVLKGQPVKREGTAQLPSVREQVALLVSLATDENILGRTWIGWSPLF